MDDKFLEKYLHQIDLTLKAKIECKNLELKIEYLERTIDALNTVISFLREEKNE